MTGTVGPAAAATSVVNLGISPGIVTPRSATIPLATRTPRTKLSTFLLDANMPNVANNKIGAKTTASLLRVSGSLKRHFSWWQRHEINPVTLRIIEQGYILPLKRIPESSFIKNNLSARNNPVFVQTAINDLLKNNLVVECEKPPFTVNPLTVAENVTKQRLVLDLREINPLLIQQPYMYEDLRFASNFFRRGQFFLAFDLRSGYHHIDIFPQHQKFLGFSWSFDGIERYFKFKVLAFGMATAGYVFSKVLRTLVRVWREKGIVIILYLDDGLILCDSLKQAIIHSRIVKKI
jgi:hypothetical protein